MSRFTGRTAVVTGGAGEIGRAVGTRLASEGARIFVVDLEPGAVASTVDALRAGGAVADGLAADVTDDRAVVAYAEAAAAFGDGRIDAFHNNAGIEGPHEPIVDYPVAAFDAVIAVNVRGVFLGLHHVLPLMADEGTVVNTASVAGQIGAPGLVAYVASKHAVIGMTRTAALEMTGRRIRVNAVCPGPIEGRMMASIERNSGLEAAERLQGGVPFGRYGYVEEVAVGVAYLLSAESGFVTGTTLTIDGGLTAR